MKRPIIGLLVIILLCLLGAVGYTWKGHHAARLAPLKPVAAKPTEAKSFETKPGEVKTTETKAAVNKPAESKPVETKPAAK